MSRSINPECEHVQGDMRTLRLGREFDAVFVHDRHVLGLFGRDEWLQWLRDAGFESSAARLDVEADVADYVGLLGTRPPAREWTRPQVRLCVCRAANASQAVVLGRPDTSGYRGSLRPRPARFAARHTRTNGRVH